jgi:zona occludens toxin (predicted ATPase)
MAIFAYTGLPGAGKSYHATIFIVDQLKAGRTVFTNLEGLNFDRISCIHGIDISFHHRLRFIDPHDKDRISNLHREAFNLLDSAEQSDCPDEIKQSAEQYRNAVFVIDEAQLYFPISTIEKHKEITGVVRWMTRHRHFGQDIVILTQHTDFLDKSIRNVIQLEYRFRKMDFIKIPLIGGPKKYGFTVSDFQSDLKLKTGFGKYSADYFNCYASATNGSEHTQMASGQMPLIFRFAFVLVLLFLGWGLYGLYNYYQKKNAPDTAPAVAPAGSSSGAGFDALQYQKREVLRLSGYISEGPTLYRLLDCSGQTTGYISESPDDYQGRLIWLDCAKKNRDQEPEPMDSAAILGY